MRRDESTYTGAGGLRLWGQRWRPDVGQPEVGAVVLVHGYAEHSGRYAEVGETLARAGWATFAFDLRGHGRSEGRRAVTDRLEFLLADVDQVVDDATAALGGRKPVLLGHSMGGGIAAAYALRGAGAVSRSADGGGGGQAKLTALVLSGPAIDVGAAMNRFQRLAAPLVSAVAPAAGVTQLPASAVSRDPAVVDAYERDPLVFHGKVPARTGHQMLRASDLIAASAGELRLPLLIVHGAADQLVPVGGSRALAANAGSQDKTLKVYDGLYHEVFNEPERDQVLGDVVAWLNRHQPTPA